MIDFSNPATLVNAGAAIPIDTQAEYDAALQAATQIYSARPGGYFDTQRLDDFENRVRGGQTLEQIIANTYDAAKREFPDSQAIESVTSTRDAQSGLGPQYTPTRTEVQQIITTAGISAATAQAAAVPSRQVADIIGGVGRTLSTQTVRPMSAGPMTSGIYSAGVGGGGLNFGTILMLGGGALLLFFLLKGHKKGRSH